METEERGFVLGRKEAEEAVADLSQCTVELVKLNEKYFSLGRQDIFLFIAKNRNYIVWKTKRGIHCSLLEEYILENFKNIKTEDIQENGNILLRGIKKIVQPLKTWAREIIK